MNCTLYVCSIFTSSFSCKYCYSTSEIDCTDFLYDDKFYYYPLLWIFCGKTTNDKVNNVHKRSLRVLLNNYHPSFEELLYRNEEVTIYGKVFKSLY